MLVGLLPLSLTPPLPCGGCGVGRGRFGWVYISAQAPHEPTLMLMNKPGRITEAGNTGRGWDLLDWAGPCFNCFCVSCTYQLSVQIHMLFTFEFMKVFFYGGNRISVSFFVFDFGISHAVFLS